MKGDCTAVDAAEYFDVTAENGRIVLTPVRVNRAGPRGASGRDRSS